MTIRELLQKVDVPEGESGNWRVERFTISEDEARFFNIRSPLRSASPGQYTRLKRKGAWDPIMSDTPAELDDMFYFAYEAKGRVLINGLGLGAAVQAVLSKPEVEHVTVIEISQDVINLVADHYLRRFGDRLTIIHADALTWQPPKDQKYDVVWHDIWDSICTDNLEEMKTLHRKYGKRAGWQASWCREECEYYNRHNW